MPFTGLLKMFFFLKFQWKTFWGCMHVCVGGGGGVGGGGERNGNAVSLCGIICTDITNRTRVEQMTTSVRLLVT